MKYENEHYRITTDSKGLYRLEEYRQSTKSRDMEWAAIGVYEDVDQAIRNFTLKTARVEGDWELYED